MSIPSLSLKSPVTKCSANCAALPWCLSRRADDKNGLAAVRERIRQAFVNQVHGDVRDEEQVRASREMLAAIAITEPPAAGGRTTRSRQKT